MTSVQYRLGMEIRQLRYLVLLAEERNFTRAAARGNVAQPALSRQLRKLEDELGVPLVDRTSRRVALTPAGHEVVEHARRALAEIDEARAVAQDALKLLGGRVTVGLTQTPGPLDAAEVLAAFHGRHPAVELVLREDLSVSLADLLRSDELDLAFVSALEGSVARQLELRRLASERLVLIVAPEHPLASRDEVRPPELSGEPFVAFPPGATIRASFDRVAGDAGFTPNIAFESTDIARTRALVARGLGVALLPESDAVAPGPRVAIVPVTARKLVHEVLLATRSGRRLAPAAAEFVRLVTVGDLPAGRTLR
jgi:DNA-binding transcriptional LysR family regulator